MPGYSRRNNDNRRWGPSNNRSGGQKPRRDDRRNMDQRRPVVSPWESGITPGMGNASLLGSYNQNQTTNAFLLGAAMARGDYGGTSTYNSYGGANKMRRLDRMGGFDDQHGSRGLLPAPNAPLIGVSPQSFSPQSRGSENLQQRLTAPWGGSSMQSGSSKGLNSGYYPSKSQQDNNSRRYIKPKRSSGSSSSRSSFRDARDRIKSSSHKRSSRDKDSISKESKTKESEGDSALKSESTDRESKPADKEKEQSKKDDVDLSETKVKDEVMETGEKEEDKDKAHNKSEEKESEDKPNESKSSEKRKHEDPFPAEALYCHICDLENFATKKGYIRHLEGITHSNMSETFHAKNAATLELLNISSKFAQMRRRDKLIRKSGKKGLPLGKIIESNLVERALHPGSCCGEQFDSPYELEEHKLTIQHLLNMYQNKKKKTEDSKIEGSEEKKLDERIDEAILKAKEEPLTLENIPSYDPSTPFGLHLIEKRPVYYCSICRGDTFRSLELHCLSHKHYDNIVSDLNKQEERRLEEKIEEEKKLEEAKREEERRKKEEEEEKEKQNGAKEDNDLKEKSSKHTKAENSEEIDDIDVNYSDEEIKSSPHKGIDKYSKGGEKDEAERAFEAADPDALCSEWIDPEEDPGEMIVLDEKEFENEYEGQDGVDMEGEGEQTPEPPVAKKASPPPKKDPVPPKQAVGRTTRSRKSAAYEDFSL